MIYAYEEKEGILKIDDKTIYFTEKENDVFKKLFNTDRLVTYQELDDIVNYGYGFNGQEYIKTIISRIRAKLGDSAEIINVSRKGYIMKPNHKNLE